MKKLTKIAKWAICVDNSLAETRLTLNQEYFLVAESAYFYHVFANTGALTSFLKTRFKLSREEVSNKLETEKLYW